MTSTTTYTTYAYSTSTVDHTSLSTNLATTTKFVTSTVTSDNVSVATVTKYTTSTKTTKSTDKARRMESSLTSSLMIQARPTPPVPTPPTAHGLEALRNGLEKIGIVRKRVVTSYVYTFAFKWETATSTVLKTNSIASVVKSTSTEYSTITSTSFRDAKSTTTVQSTVVVTSTQVVTPTTTSDTSATESHSKSTTSSDVNTIVVQTTFAVNTTHSGNDEVASVTSNADGGGGNGEPVTTGITTSTSASSSPTSVTTTTANATSLASGSTAKSGLSLGVKAGIGAGAGAAGLALLSAMIFFTVGKRRQSNSSHNRHVSMTPSTMADWTPPPPPPVRFSQIDSRELSYEERAAALARSMENKGEPLPSPGYSKYRRESGFSEMSSRVASPAAPSMRFGSPMASAQEVFDENTPRNDVGWHVPSNDEFHDIPGPSPPMDELHLHSDDRHMSALSQQQHYHDMHSSPTPSHSRHPSPGFGW